MKSHRKEIEQLKFALILGLIFVVSYLAFRVGEDLTLPAFMRWYVGVFLLTFASIKLFDYKEFVMMFSVYDVIARRLNVYAYAYPFILVGLAGLYFVDAVPLFRNSATLIVALIASIGPFRDVVLSRSQSSCGIFGNIIRLPFTTVSLVESAALVGLTAVTLFLL